MAKQPMPDQPQYLRISQESSCNTLMQAMKTDGLTDRHAQEQIRAIYEPPYKIMEVPEYPENSGVNPVARVP
jgi:hypothetical protein